MGTRAATTDIPYRKRIMRVQRSSAAWRKYRCRAKTEHTRRARIPEGHFRGAHLGEAVFLFECETMLAAGDVFFFFSSFPTMVAIDLVARKSERNLVGAKRLLSDKLTAEVDVRMT